MHPHDIPCKNCWIAERQLVPDGGNVPAPAVVYFRWMHKEKLHWTAFCGGCLTRDKSMLGMLPQRQLIDRREFELLESLSGVLNT